MFEMHDHSYQRNFTIMSQCIDVIKHYGQRYGAYFAPEFVVHCRRYGDPFRSFESARQLFPSGCSFNAYLYYREEIYKQHEEDGAIVIDLTTTEADYDSGVPSIDLSDEE
jgi:hypothetical protein